MANNNGGDLLTLASVTQIDHNGVLSEDEAARYDRQIRLWGLDAQKRMRSSSVLLIGFRGIHAEVCKNIVLAGVGKVTILDSSLIQPQDLAANFFLDLNDVGKPRVGASSLDRVRRLNPLVFVEGEEKKLSELPDSYFQNFNIVSISDASHQDKIRINDACRVKNTPFYAAETFGFYAYFFSDLNNFVFREEPAEAPAPSSVSSSSSSSSSSSTSPAPLPQITKKVRSPALSEISQHKWNPSAMRRTSKFFIALQVLQHFRESQSQSNLLSFKKEYFEKSGIALSLLSDELLEEVARTEGADFSPVCAIVGGLLGQEVIKVLAAKEEPIHNFFLYHGLEGAGMVEQVQGASVVLSK